MKSKNKIDWNFHINFSPLYFVFAVMVLMAISFNAEAEEIEEVVVVAQEVTTTETNPACALLGSGRFINQLHVW